jgi:hypothetical protein
MPRHPRLFLLCCCWLGVLTAFGQASPAALAPGDRLEALPVGSTTYHTVEIRSVNAHTLVILHAGGMASLRLRDLSPEWQARFHYDPAADAAVEPAASPPVPARAAPKPRPGEKSKFETLLQKFGEPAVVQDGVDLRPQFFALELGVKSQGRRPSCAIFAIVSALEFQNAEAVGHAEKLSEEYLIWAVRKTVRRAVLPGAAVADEAETPEDRDEGFTLPEVVAAVRAYGIPLHASMPDTFGSKMAAITEPPPDVITEARTHQRVFIERVPGRDTATRLSNILHVLNAGIPVPIGLAWPNYRSLRGGYLNAQKPMEGIGHAVTLVGYKSASGRLEDTVFIFKNSYGPDWGQGGYGTVTYAYLSNYLQDAVLLEVQHG